MKKMNNKEYEEFLRSGTRTAHISTVNSDSTPHVVPVWFELDGNDIVFTTGGDSVKAQNLKRNHNVCLSIDDPHPPYAFIKIEGRASISDDPGEMLKWATMIGGRYMGMENAEIFGKRNSVLGEILVRITPERISAYKDIAGW